MKLSSAGIEVIVNEELGEISSIKFNNKEVVYQGDEGWKKSFPMLFPAIGISKESIFNDKSFMMPKHGFWRDLDWKIHYENEEMVLTTISQNKVTPFIFDLETRIKITNNRVEILVSVTNASQGDAYFHFGWHPGFIINNETTICLDKNETAKGINGQSEIVESSNININNKKIFDLPFGEDFDTFVFENTSITNVALKNKDYILNLYFNEPNLLIWRKLDNNFVCIEPCHGGSDLWYKDSPVNLTKKDNIIHLKNCEVYKSSFVIEFNSIKKIN